MHLKLKLRLPPAAYLNGRQPKHCVDATSLLKSMCIYSLMTLGAHGGAEVMWVRLEFQGSHTNHPLNPRTWWRSLVRDPLLLLSSCPPLFSISCVGFETRSWCVSRWGWGSARALRGEGARCICWRETLSRAQEAALWCKLSVCACSLRPLPCNDLPTVLSKRAYEISLTSSTGRVVGICSDLHTGQESLHNPRPSVVVVVESEAGVDEILPDHPVSTCYKR